MSIEAINEQLLRAIGVGVAILDRDRMLFKFRNDTFESWFGSTDDTLALSELFPEINLEDLDQNLKDTGRYTAETRFKKKRRTMVIAVDFTAANDNGHEIAVLVCQNITRIRELESMIDSYSSMVERNTREIKREKEQVEKLLLNIMPRSVYEEYKTFGVVAPQLYDQVSVLTLGFENFSAVVANSDPSVLVTELNDIYSAFDRIGEQFGCDRIKTVGDSYIAVAGLPEPDLNHARAVANAALRFVRYLERRNKSHPNQWHCRIGLANGPVVGSVVGIQKYVYDIFGPAVNLATRIQEISKPMSITMDHSMSQILAEHFDLKSIGVNSVSEFEDQELWTLQDSKKGLTQ